MKTKSSIVVIAAAAVLKYASYADMCMDVKFLFLDLV